METKKFMKKLQDSIRQKGVPVYFPKKNAYVGGYCLEIWNLGISPQSFFEFLKNTRVAIRKNGESLLVLKTGNI